MRLLRILGLAVLAALSGAPVTALNYPQTEPFVGLYAFPEAEGVTWEIASRFSAFNGFDAPDEVFSAYRFLPGESARDWHARLWNRGGFASPYAAPLSLIWPFAASEFTYDDPARAPLPWDAVTQLHRPPALEYLRNEDNPDYRILVRLSHTTDRPCEWQPEDGRRIPSIRCSDPVLADIPITGGQVRLRYRGALAGTTVAIKPRHEVIVAMGDSYGSGEGNPDLPAVWRDDYEPPPGETTWLGYGDRSVLASRARWLDERCHRSFFNYQTLTALAYSSADPHRVVTYLQYSCTGAEVFDGILLPQLAPGRVSELSTELNRFSQLNAAVLELCRAGNLTYESVKAEVLAGTDVTRFYRRGEIGASELKLGDAFDLATRAARAASGDLVNPRGGFLNCPPEALRKPDLVLLSIGGNDIGFGNLIRYFLVPIGKTFTQSLLPEFCPAPAYRYTDSPAAARHCRNADRDLGFDSGDLVGLNGSSGLRARFALLTRALREALQVLPEQMVLPIYPDPLRTGSAPDENEPDSSFCGPVPDRDVAGAAWEYDPLSPFNALKSADPTGSISRWPFNLSRDEAALALGQIEDMRTALRRAGEATGITVVCATRDAFLGHGWWLGPKLNLPSHGSVFARWKPAEWEPYVFRRADRAVRTGNDSFLTQASGERDIHGIFHPNLIGHTLMADRVLNRLEE